MLHNIIHRGALKYVEIGEDELFFSSTHMEFYCRYFYDLDHIITSAISDQFDQAGSQTYKKIEFLKQHMDRTSVME